MDYVPVPADSTQVVFNDLHLGRSSQTVVCRLIRFWDSRNVRKDNQFMGITLLFLDEKNDVIHGFVPSTLANEFRSVLREGFIYKIDSFDVGRCTKLYKITDNPFVIRVLPQTVFAPVDAPIPIEALKFMLRNPDHLQALANTNLELPDVVGQIRFVQGSNLNDASSTQRVVVRLHIDKELRVCLSLWDDAAATFRAHMSADSQLHSVMIVTTVNPKLFGGNLFLNSTAATRFYFNPTINAIQKFKDSMGINGDCGVFTRTDTATASMKMETLTITELQKYISRPTEETQEADFLCRATIVRVLDSNGWSYVSCGACSRKLDRNGTGLKCNQCASSRVTGIVRYRVELEVQDTNGRATFVVIDSEMTKQTSKTAGTLAQEVEDADQGKVPHRLRAFIGKTYLFKIKVSPFNFTPKHRTFTVSSMTDETGNEGRYREEPDMDRMLQWLSMVMQGQVKVSLLKK